MRAAAALLLALAASPALAQATADIIDRKDIPAAVKDAVLCGADDPETIFGRPFAGGYVFAWPCPGNHANFIQALVFAENKSGLGARLLRFPSSRRKNQGDEEPALELANVRWFPARRELLSFFIDAEGGGFCRTEGRWRLVGRKPEPVLVSFRKTRDCDGKRGWVTVVSPR